MTSLPSTPFLPASRKDKLVVWWLRLFQRAKPFSATKRDIRGVQQPGLGVTVCGTVDCSGTGAKTRAGRERPLRGTRQR